jgi:hypothetical protein
MTTRAKLILVLTAIILIVLIVIFGSKPYPEITPEENTKLEVIRRRAYNDAVECSNTKQPKLKYEDIYWVVIPSSKLRVQAVDGSIDLAGFFNPTDSAIYLPYPSRNKRWILVHESLHAIGYLGHPDFPFRQPCGVMSDQN